MFKFLLITPTFSGRGNVKNEGVNRRKPPLRWMVLKARTYRLSTSLRQLEEEFLKDDKIEVIESLMWPWWVLEVLPGLLKRMTFTRRKRRFTYKFVPFLFLNAQLTGIQASSGITS